MSTSIQENKFSCKDRWGNPHTYVMRPLDPIELSNQLPNILLVVSGGGGRLFDAFKAGLGAATQRAETTPNEPNKAQDSSAPDLSGVEAFEADLGIGEDRDGVGVPSGLDVADLFAQGETVVTAKEIGERSAALVGGVRLEDIDGAKIGDAVAEFCRMYFARGGHKLLLFLLRGTRRDGLKVSEEFAFKAAYTANMQELFVVLGESIRWNLEGIIHTPPKIERG